MLMKESTDRSMDPRVSQTENHCEFYNLLCQQRDLYRELKVLTDRQHRAVLSGAVNQLIGVLSKRRNVLERLSLMNKKISPLQARWNHEAPNQRRTQANEIRQVVAEVRGLLREIIQTDEASREKLEKNRDEVSTQLVSLGQSHRSVKAYASKPSVEASWITDQAA